MDGMQMQQGEGASLYLDYKAYCDAMIKKIAETMAERIVRDFITGHIRLWPYAARYNLARQLWPQKGKGR